MVGWWPGDGTAEDIRGGNNGTLQGGATFATGLVGQAFSFNGTSSTVEIANTPNLNQVTVDAWIFIPSDTPADGTYGIVGRYLSVPGERGYELFVSAGKLVLRASEPNQTAQCSVVSTNNVAFGEWSHVAGTVDSNECSDYINGNLDGSQPGLSSIQATGQNLFIGTRESAQQSVFFFRGLIDEVELFNRALSAGEIQSMYDAGDVGKCKPTCVTPPPGLTHWWPGDNTATDIQGSNNGTLKNGAYRSGLTMVAYEGTFTGTFSQSSGTAGGEWVVHELQDMTAGGQGTWSVGP